MNRHHTQERIALMPLKDKGGGCRSRQENLLTVVGLTPEKKEREGQSQLEIALTAVHP